MNTINIYTRIRVTNTNINYFALQISTVGWKIHTCLGVRWGAGWCRVVSGDWICWNYNQHSQSWEWIWQYFYFVSKLAICKQICHELREKLNKILIFRIFIIRRIRMHKLHINRIHTKFKYLKIVSQSSFKLAICRRLCHKFGNFRQYIY